MLQFYSMEAQVNELLFRLLSGQKNDVPKLLEKNLMQKLSQNRLLGYAAHEFIECFSLESQKSLKTRQQETTVLNSVLFNEIEQLEACLRKENISYARLKATAYYNEIYPQLGVRELNDFDIFVDNKYLIEAFLKSNDYYIIPETTWEAGTNRTAWYKNLSKNFEISIDVHTDIYWQCPKSLRQNFEKNNSLFHRLAPEAHLVHLLANWIYQDNFVSLDKLVDIQRFLNVFAEDFNWALFDQLIKDSQLMRALYCAQYIITKHLLQNGFKGSKFIKTKHPLYCLLITKSFLSDPQKHILRYSLFRFIMRKSTVDAFRYLSGWTKAYGYKRLFRKFLN